MAINKLLPPNTGVKGGISQQLANAESHLASGQFQMAILLLSEIDMTAAPSSVVSTRDFLLGRAHLENKQPGLALAVLERARGHYKNNAAFRLAYGAAFHLNNDLEAAEKHYREAIRLAPLAENPHFNLAKLLGDQANYYGAIKSYQTALLRRPNYTNAMAELAKLLGKQGNLREALDLLNKALTIDQRHALSWNIYGELLERAGDHVDAVKNFQKAVDCDPQFSDGWYNLARMAQLGHDTDSATFQIDKALAIDPQNEKYLFLKGSLNLSRS